MALSSAVVWEVRTAGASTNGGGFKFGASGTDWSQQSSPQYSVTDGVTAGTTTITSATAAFGTDVVGNIIYVQGGTGSVVAGWYEIISRTNSTTIVVDRSTGLTAGTGVTLKIGGAISGVKVAYDASVAGNTIWIKADGTYTENTTIALREDSAPTRISGYTTTRGDRLRPTIQRGSGTGIMIHGNGGNYHSLILEDVTLDCNSLATTGVFVGGFVGNSIRRVEVKNYTTTGISAGGNAGSGGTTVVANCVAHDGTSGSTSGISITGGSLAWKCKVYNFYGVGILAFNYNNSSAGVFSCLIYTGMNGTADGIVLNDEGTAGASTITAIGNTVHGVRHGLRSDGGGYTVAWDVADNIFSVCSGYGINLTGTPQLTIPGSDRNAFYSCTSGQVTSNLLNHNAVTLTASPFVNAGTDFSLNNASGGGLLCRGTGTTLLT